MHSKKKTVQCSEKENKEQKQKAKANKAVILYAAEWLY